MSAAIRAAELLGRELHGMFMERREVTTREDIRQVSDAEAYEGAALAAEAFGEPEFAAKLRKQAESMKNWLE
jgi:hypothetical protein